MKLEEINFLNIKIENLVGLVFAMHVMVDKLNGNEEDGTLSPYQALLCLLDCCDRTLNETTDYMDQVSKCKCCN